MPTQPAVLLASFPLEPRADRQRFALIIVLEQPSSQVIQVAVLVYAIRRVVLRQHPRPVRPFPAAFLVRADLQHRLRAVQRSLRDSLSLGQLEFLPSSDWPLAQE